MDIYCQELFHLTAATLRIFLHFEKSLKKMEHKVVFKDILSLVYTELIWFRMIHAKAVKMN